MNLLLGQCQRAAVRRGFTLTELAVTLAIVSTLTTSLLPAIRAARAAGARWDMRYEALSICRDAAAFKVELGHYPNNLAELGDQLGLFDSGAWKLLGDGTVIIGHDLYRLYYTADNARVGSWLQSLLSLDPDSQEFVNAVSADSPAGPLLVLASIGPIYLGAGTMLIYLDVSDCRNSYSVTDLDSLRTQRDAVKTAALQSAAIMLQNETDPFRGAHEVPLILKEPETARFVFGTFDRNADDEITLGEFSYVSRQLADQEVNDESSLGTRVTQQLFSVVVEELQLTDADDTDDTVLLMDGDPYEPAELFSYENLCEHTEVYVAEGRTRDHLCRRLLQAQFLEVKGQLQPRDNVLTAQQRHLQRLSGKELSPDAAEELQILTEVRKGFGR